MDKLLIVDQNQQIVDLIGKLLSEVNYDIYTANSGKTALAKINMIKPDLILMDTDLYDISGFDVCKTLKSNNETKYILVLMLISVETKDYILRSVHSGADDYITKNFDSTILMSKVNSLLRVKHLSDRINTQYLELKEKNNLIEFQLKMARQVQRSIIRDINFSLDGLNVISKYLPALEIGGDFYAVTSLDETHVGIILGDVSGHGISAALLTSMLNMMFTNLSNKYDKPNELLIAMNKQFYNIFENSNNEMYACVFYAIIDISKLNVIYSNAGQAYPVFVNSQNNTAEELVLGGIPIGLMEETIYENKTFNYHHGDLLFMHTDGLSDFLYKDNPKEFTHKLKNELQTCALETDKISDIIETVLNEFYQYNESKKYENDDVSIILCRF